METGTAGLLLTLGFAIIAAGSETRIETRISDKTAGTTLVQALRNQSVTAIVLDDDYSVARTKEFGAGAAAADEFPIPINRNITIRSSPGTWPTLDMDFAFELVKLCATCILTLHGNLTIANDRRGTNPTYDFITGDPGSRVACEGVYRLRLACTPAQESVETIQRFPRSRRWPSEGDQQHVEIRDVLYRGKLYPDSVVVIDASFDVPFSHVEGRGDQGGYSQQCRHVVRLCESFVTEDCLQRDGPDTCVNEQIDRIRGAVAQPSGPSPAMLGGVVAGVLCAAALAAAGLLLLCRKRRRRQSQQDQRLPQHACKVVKAVTDSEAGTHNSDNIKNQTDRSRIGGLGNQAVNALPKGSGREWEIISSFSDPGFGTNDEGEIAELGAFIGAGSFGKVYRACCRGGREVAVKIVEHTAAATSAVQNEMTLQMSFHSPNVVAAYRCITFGKTKTSDSINCRGDSCSTAATAGSANRRSDDNCVLYIAPMSTSTTTERPADSTPNTRASEEGGSTREWQGYAGANEASRRNSTPETGSQSIEQQMELCTWLVQEYCDQGTLKEYVIKSCLSGLKAGQPEAMARLLNLLLQAASGLQTLHLAHVVHGDLNCRNILVASDPSAAYGVRSKVADLGISRALQQHKTHRTTAHIGTITHSAPELLRFGRMSPASDVFSFGVMIWALFTGQEPYVNLPFGMFFEVVVMNDVRPLVPPEMPLLLCRLMEHAWASRADERPTVQQLLGALEYLLEVLPAQMAAGTCVTVATAAEAAEAADIDPDPEARPDLRIPSTLARRPSRHQQRQQCMQQLAAAMAAAEVCDGRSDSNILVRASEVPSGILFGTDSAAGEQQQVNTRAALSKDAAGGVEAPLQQQQESEQDTAQRAWFV